MPTTCISWVMTRSGLRAEHLGVQGEFQGAGQFRIDRVCRSPAQGLHRLERRLGVDQRVADRLVLDDR
jgi:hypothetical protein